MTDVDTEALRQIVSADMRFTYMGGRQQSREEFLADIERGDLKFESGGTGRPAITVERDLAAPTCTSVLNAFIRSQGISCIKGTHWYSLQGGS